MKRKGRERRGGEGGEGEGREEKGKASYHAKSIADTPEAVICPLFTIR